MKKHTLLLTGVLFASVTLAAQADIVASADFDGSGYVVDDSITGVSGGDDVGLTGGWQNPTYKYSSDNPSDSSSYDASAVVTQTVASGGLNYINGDVYVSGGSNHVNVTSTTYAQVQALGNDIDPGIALTGQTFYERFVIADNSDVNKNSYAIMGIGSSTGFSNNAGVGVTAASSGSTPVTGAQLPIVYTNSSSVQTTATSSDYLSAGNNLLVAEFVWDNSANNDIGGYDTVNFFLNPQSTIQGTATATGSLPVSADGYDPTNLGSFIGLYLANTPTTYEIDSFAIGTSYSDVVTAPEPRTWAMMFLGCVGLLAFVTRLRRIVS